MQIDIAIVSHGSICIAYGRTPVGRGWIKETAPDDAQFWGGGMVVEPRYVDHVAGAAENDGLDVEVLV
jgi:hypothetical protein